MTASPEAASAPPAVGLRVDRLGPEACRDEQALRAFVEERISVNAWPIYCRPLRRLIRREGLDLAAARKLEVPLSSLRELMRRMYAGSRRAERLLSIDNAFHHTLHNYDVAVRLLLLEWPDGEPIPEESKRLARRAYTSFEAVEQAIMALLTRLHEAGVPTRLLARDLLTAAGHDYGHTGGTDRRLGSGELHPLTHEDIAEKHAAKFGIDAGLPPALILESMAGIRVTTLHVRPGRRKVQAINDFERKVMLADVAGCVKRPDLWMTRVAIPVLAERMEPWKRRLNALPGEMAALEKKIAATAEDDPAQPRLRARLKELEAEDAAIIKTVTQAIDSELRFVTFIRDHRLAPVPCGRRLWWETIENRVALVEGQLARKDLLEPLDAFGFAFVAEMAYKLSNVDNFRETLENSGIHPNLRHLYDDFLP